MGTRLRVPPAATSGAAAPAGRTHWPACLPCASKPVTSSASMNSPNRRVTVAMWSSLISLRLLPRLLRIFCQKLPASISCTLPQRAAGFLLERIQT
jgi:hypothetical protein